MSIAALSSEAAQALFESGYVIQQQLSQLAAMQRTPITSTPSSGNSGHRRGAASTLCPRHKRTYQVKGGRSTRTSRTA